MDEIKVDKVAKECNLIFGLRLICFKLGFEDLDRRCEKCVFPSKPGFCYVTEKGFGDGLS